MLVGREIHTVVIRAEGVFDTSTPSNPILSPGYLVAQLEVLSAAGLSVGLISSYSEQAVSDHYQRLIAFDWRRLIRAVAGETPPHADPELIGRAAQLLLSTLHVVPDHAAMVSLFDEDLKVATTLGMTRVRFSKRRGGGEDAWVDSLKSLVLLDEIGR